MDDEDGFPRPFDLEGARLAQLDEDMRYELIEATWNAGIEDANEWGTEPAEGYPFP